MTKQKDVAAQKSTILFVGSFVKEGRDGSVGGQMFACRTLLNSQLKDKHIWLLIDSTGKVPARPIYERMVYACVRLLKFVAYIILKRVDMILVFTGDGAGFLEKGLMILFAKFVGKRTIVAPRSGFILRDIKKPILKKFIKAVFKKSDLVICQSRFWRSIFIDVYPKGNYQIVHNWIDSSRYHNQRAFTEKPIIQLLFLGWVVEEKGIYELIEAVTALRKEGYPIQLSVGGQGTAYEEINKKIKQQQLESFIFMKGWIRNEAKLQILEESDIFILPTHFEGFPNALIEAMASGLPTVASNIAPISSLVEDKIHALLFECGSSSDLKDKIELLMNDMTLRQTLSKNAQSLIQSKFSIEYGVKQFEQIL